MIQYERCYSLENELMIMDLLIGIASSLIATFIVNYLGKRTIGKRDDDSIISIYILFLSVVTFIVSALITVLLSEAFSKKIAELSGVQLERFYRYCSGSFLFIVIIVSVVTGIVILVESVDRSSRRDYEQDMDRYTKLR